jgi:glutaredoxin
MKKVVLYGREGCCLCDQAREVVTRVRARQVFQLEERDIDADERLFKAYLERIPVVTIDGVEAFEFFVDEDVFEQLLTDGAPRR